MADGSGLKEGSTAPEITILNDSIENPMTGDKRLRLISFWTPKNPASRISNSEYSKYFSAHPESEIDFISICIDEDDILGKEVLKKDGISEESGRHFLFSDVDKRVFKDFGVEENPEAFLINEKGKILSVSPSAGMLEN